MLTCKVKNVFKVMKYAANMNHVLGKQIINIKEAVFENPTGGNCKIRSFN